MCVYAADDELIAPEVFELLFERGTHEGGVAPFGEHGIGFGGGEFIEDPGVFVVLQAVAPEVCQQAPVGGVLAGWLGGVVDRDVRRVCRIQQTANIGNSNIDLSVWEGLAVAFQLKGAHEIALHIVHEKRGARGIDPPVRAVLMLLFAVRIRGNLG